MCEDDQRSGGGVIGAIRVDQVLGTQGDQKSGDQGVGMIWVIRMSG